MRENFENWNPILEKNRDFKKTLKSFILIQGKNLNREIASKSIPYELPQLYYTIV